MLPAYRFAEKAESGVIRVKMKSLFAAALLFVAGPLMAGPVNIFNLNTLSVPGYALLGNSFTEAGAYEDRYQFTIDQSASASGLVLELDLLSRLDISISNIALSGSTGLIGFDTSPLYYNFNSFWTVFMAFKNC